MKGNYMGYCDFDDVRYWDVRDLDKVTYHIIPKKKHLSLPSDATKRADRNTLIDGDFALAQTKKEELEILQRHDRKLRKACDDRRKEEAKKQ